MEFTRRKRQMIFADGAVLIFHLDGRIGQIQLALAQADNAEQLGRLQAVRHIIGHPQLKTDAGFIPHRAAAIDIVFADFTHLGNVEMRRHRRTIGLHKHQSFQPA